MVYQNPLARRSDAWTVIQNLFWKKLGNLSDTGQTPVNDQPLVIQVALSVRELGGNDARDAIK